MQLLQLPANIFPFVSSKNETETELERRMSIVTIAVLVELQIKAQMSCSSAYELIPLIEQ